MPDIDFEGAVAASLHRTADAVRAQPVRLTHIEHRAGRLRQRRRRRRFVLVAPAVVIAAVAVAGGLYLTCPADRVTVAVGESPSSVPSATGLADLVDTTTGHRCPSISAQPTPPTSIIAGMEPTPAGDAILVPSSLSPGYCATAPSTILPYDVVDPFTVLASCAHCAAPTAAVAISRSSTRDTWGAQTTTGEQTGTIDGVTYGYKPPEGRGGRAQLAWPEKISVGNAPAHSFLLIGHGLSKGRYLELAARLAQSRPAAVPGLRTVYTGRADQLDEIPSGVSRDATLTWVTENGEQMVTYSYQHLSRPPSLASWSWEYVHPRAVSTDRGTVVYATDPEAAGHAYDYLLVTDDAVMTVQYVSAVSRPAPIFPLTMLRGLQSVSTSSTAWTAFTNLASRHTTRRPWPRRGGSRRPAPSPTPTPDRRPTRSAYP